jgi:hypothetical protein
VQGIWRANYTYRLSNGETKGEEQFIELRQFSRYVWGHNLTGSSHWYRIHGKLDRETYLTGEWETKLYRNIYHGAFQFILAPAGDSMKGKWIGFNSHGYINHGPWEWRLVTQKIDRKTTRAVVNQH